MFRPFWIHTSSPWIAGSASLALVSLCSSASAQNCAPPASPVLEAAVTGLAPGPVGEVTESTIAVGVNDLMVATTLFTNNGAGRVKLAFRSCASGLWSPAFELTNLCSTSNPKPFDPSLAFDSLSGHFFVATIAVSGPISNALSILEFVPGSTIPALAHPCIVSGPDGPFDKPWIVAGDPGELYVMWSEDSPNDPWRFYCIRGVDSGASWSIDATNPSVQPIEVPGTTGTEVVTGRFAIQPATLPGKPLIAAYSRDWNRVEFLLGVDSVDAQSRPTVQFTRILDAAGDPIHIDLNRAIDVARHVIPGNADFKHTAQIALDPYSPLAFYVAYQDVRIAGGKNVNVYVRRVSFESGAWVMSSPVRVNDDPLPPAEPASVVDYHTDQFLPSIAVDADGRVHVTYYDDRRFRQADPIDSSSPASPASFDWARAVSSDQGQTFTNQLVTSAANDAGTGVPLPYYQYPGAKGFREYTGLATAVIGASPVVWASAVGTDTSSGSPVQTIFVTGFTP